MYISRLIPSSEKQAFRCYFEFAVASNFSFLRGASHPEELMLQAAHIGLDGSISSSDARPHAERKKLDEVEQLEMTERLLFIGVSLLYTHDHARGHTPCVGAGLFRPLIESTSSRL